MNHIFKFCFLLPLMLFAVACSNDDEPALPELKGEVENGFFTNLITSNEFRLFNCKKVATYRKYDSEDKWQIDDASYDGDITPNQLFLFRGGKLYFVADWAAFESSYVDFAMLSTLYYDLIKAGKTYPLFFVESPLNFNAERNELTYVFCAHKTTSSVVSAGGDSFRLSTEQRFTNSFGDGAFMYINDFTDEGLYYASGKNDLYFASWTDLANYLVDEATEILGADYKQYGAGPSLEEIRAFYSDPKFGAQ